MSRGLSPRPSMCLPASQTTECLLLRFPEGRSERRADRNEDRRQPRSIETTSASLALRAGVPRCSAGCPGASPSKPCYVGSKSDRLRNDDLNNINMVPFGAMLNNPNGNADAIGRSSCGRASRSWSTLSTPITTRGRASSADRPGKFSFTGAYTFSKALGIRGGGGSTGRRSTRRASRSFASTRMACSATIDVTFSASPIAGCCQRWAAGLTNAILGNWQVSGHIAVRERRSAAGARGRRQLPDRWYERQGVPITSTNIAGSPRHPGDAGPEL